MKRSLIEVFKYIDLVTWYSAIRVNKLWLAAGTSNEIVSGMFGCPTYKVYLQTKNRKYHYYYTTWDIMPYMHYEDGLLATEFCAHPLSKHFYKKLDLSYEIVNEKGTFVFHKITQDISILRGDSCSIITIDDAYYIFANLHAMSMKQTLWNDFKYHVDRYGMETMIQRSICPSKLYDRLVDHDKDKPVDYNKYILAGIAILGIISHCLRRTKN